jgi:hypothetical protein
MVSLSAFWRLLRRGLRLAINLGALSSSNHGSDQVFVVGKARENDPDHVERDQGNRDIRQNLVRFLDRKREALLIMIRLRAF